MKKFILIASLLLIPSFANAQQFVNGYYRSNGTYVQPYYRSTPDGNPYNNYSTRGNINPYTGQAGTVNPSDRTYGNSNGLLGSPAGGFLGGSAGGLGRSSF